MTDRHEIWHIDTYIDPQNHIRFKNPRWWTADILKKNSKIAIYFGIRFSDRHEIWHDGAH